MLATRPRTRGALGPTWHTLKVADLLFWTYLLFWKREVISTAYAAYEGTAYGEAVLRMDRVTEGAAKGAVSAGAYCVLCTFPAEKAARGGCRVLRIAFVCCGIVGDAHELAASAPNKIHYTQTQCAILLTGQQSASSYANSLSIRSTFIRSGYRTDQEWVLKCTSATIKP